MKRYGKLALVSTLCMTVFISSLSTFAQETPKFIYGVASWYGEQFEGKPTASGEPFSMNGLTAAHKTLPFGTRLEIENLGNGKKVEVRINDRGPFTENRILDLSKQAAEILDFVGEGKTFVKATVLELGDPLNKPMPAAGSTVAPKQDIPQGFNAPADLSAPTNVVTAPSVPATENLQASAKDESDFMNDVVPQVTEAPLRSQLIPTIDPFGESTTNNIYGFASNQQPAPLTDPLGGRDPIMPELDPTADLTPTDNYTVYPEDSFGDLFSDTAEPKDFFPPNMGGGQGNEAQNVGSDFTQPSAPTYIPIPTPAPTYSQPVIVPAPEPAPTYREPAPTRPQRPAVKPSAPSSIPGWTISPPTAQQAPEGYYVVQLGAFSKSDNAMKVYNMLKKSSDLALNNVYTIDANIVIKGKAQNVMRIRVGFFTDENVALQKAAQIDREYQNLGIKSSVIKVDFLP